ncbi:MAG: PEP-CTERM sorting domain-containing protein [Pirellulales bacterium]
MRLHGVIAVMSLALAATVSPFSSALADDFAPPPWRGGPNDTLQGWEFLDAGNQVSTGGYAKVADDPNVAQRWGNGPVPFFVPVPGIGSSTPDPLATWTDTWTWDPGADGDGGWTPQFIPGSMTLWIPNWIDNELLKLLRIQFTYDGLPPEILGPILGGFGTDPLNTVPGTPVGPPVFVDNRHYYQDWRIVPNPHWDRIGLLVPVGTRLDEIVVDTISFTIPEPSSALLMALALVGILAWHRR